MATKMVDDGECDHITPEELEQIAAIIHRPQYLGREDAARYLKVSLNRFHELRDSGLIKEPKKVAGQKEKLYSMCDLKKSKKDLESMK